MKRPLKLKKQKKLLRYRYTSGYAKLSGEYHSMHNNKTTNNNVLFKWSYAILAIIIFIIGFIGIIK